MKKYKSAIIIALVLLPHILYAQSQLENNFTDRLWMEIWSDTSYRSTNFGSEEKDNKEVDFFIPFLSLRTGSRYALTDYLFLDPYFKLIIVADWGKNSWNDVYWNNHFDWGFGARIVYDYRDNRNKKGVIWIDNFSIDFFTEYLFIENSLDNSKDKLPANIHSENLRLGFSSWLSVDSKTFCFNSISIWGEMWSEFAYESTNFSDEDYNNYYILSLNPRVGLKWKLPKMSIQPYYRFSVRRDFGDKHWNKEPWLNNIEYGPGIRLSLGELLPIEETGLHLYAEILNKDYFERVEREKYAGQSDADFRVGIDIWLPLGAAKGRLSRH